jgi:hypothetical protein
LPKYEKWISANEKPGNEKFWTELNRLIFDKKATAEISANLNEVKGIFTVLAKVDLRAA